jgi:hypothetical protein
VAVFGSPGRRGVRLGGSGAYGGVGNGSLVPIVHSESVDSVPDTNTREANSADFARVQQSLSHLHSKVLFRPLSVPSSSLPSRPIPGPSTQMRWATGENAPGKSYVVFSSRST